MPESMSYKPSQITTITFFKYQTLSQKFWSFQMMQFAHAPLGKVKGQTFYKLMGSGKNEGFNPFPDWSVYSLLQVWESASAADAFFKEAELMNRYRKHATEIWTIYMKNIKANGAWSKQNPFQPAHDLDEHNKHVAVITRATIKLSKLVPFWKYVPTSHQPLKHNSGLIYTKGIGEIPVIQMATFSLWKDWESVKKFAYESKEHNEAIRKTRALNWYSEELFSRFQPYRSEGTWEGKNLLLGLGNSGHNT